MAAVDLRDAKSFSGIQGSATVMQLTGSSMKNRHLRFEMKSTGIVDLPCVDY